MLDLSPYPPGQLVRDKEITAQQKCLPLTLLSTYKDKHFNINHPQPLYKNEGITVPRWINPSYGSMIACIEDRRSMYLLSGAKIIGHINDFKNIKNVNLRRKQYQKYEDNSHHINFAITILKAKIEQQILILRFYWRKFQNTDYMKNINLIPSLNTMRQCQLALDANKTIAELRGYEGKAAQEYFYSFAKLLNLQKFKRIPREKPCHINLLFDYAYAHLTKTISLLLLDRGFDIASGIIHAEDNTKPSMTLDCMEPLRPLVADRWVINILQSKVKNMYEEQDGQWGFSDKARRIVRLKWIDWMFSKRRNQIQHCIKLVNNIYNHYNYGENLQINVEQVR